MKYIVVCWQEHLRDGAESGAKVVEGLAEAQEFIDTLSKCFTSNLEFRLFELGKEINQVERVIEEVPQPPKKMVKFRIKE